MTTKMHESLIIREATVEDSAVIAAIYNESILASDSTMIDQPIHVDEILGHFKKFSDHEGYMVLEQDRYIVGWGVIKQFEKTTAYRYTAETSVFLRRNELGKGYGTRLKRALIDRCKALGYRHLVARIWASNTVSIEYNRKFGYEMVGIQREIGFMNGVWQDIALMQLVLE